MLIISMRDNENNTWKRNAKTKNQKETTKKSKQDRKEQGGGGGRGGGRSNSERVRAKWFCCASISSLYNTPCNRFYNNYVINICPRQLLWFI